GGGGPAGLPDGVVLASMSAMQAGEPVAAVIGYKAGHGGTDLYMSCVYVEPNSTGDIWNLQLVFFYRNAPQELGPTWQARPGEYQRVQAHSTHSPKDITEIQVQRAGGFPLLSYKAT
ncbi:MAG TPA: hypothetical protein VJT31_40055, partial [Rugosimonospora sp.]|nr:hypothetical protein [Rugosimonospora sp.]